MGMGFAPTWLRQVSPPLLHKTTLTTGCSSSRTSSSWSSWCIFCSDEFETCSTTANRNCLMRSSVRNISAWNVCCRKYSLPEAQLPKVVEQWRCERRFFITDSHAFNILLLDTIGRLQLLCACTWSFLFLYFTNKFCTQFLVVLHHIYVTREHLVRVLQALPDLGLVKP